MPANVIEKFRGLNNVTDPLRLGLEWLQTADNINITDTGTIERRDGYALAMAGDISGAYATFDRARMYIVDAGVLKAVMPDLTTRTYWTGLARTPVYWAEMNDQVFFTNGVDSGVIYNGGVTDWDWEVPAEPDVRITAGNLPAGTYQIACTRYIGGAGRETGASPAVSIDLNGSQGLVLENIPMYSNVYLAPANSTVFQLITENVTTGALVWNQLPDELGVDLMTQHLSPLPKGCEYIAAWQGRMYAAQYDPTSDMSVVWCSEPLGFHLFDLQKNFFMLPGRVTMLAPHDEALIVGTDKEIYAYTSEALTSIADYGVVPGWGWVRDEDTPDVYFWSTRGLCRALPFSNVTLRQISVNCGLSAAAAIISKNGAKRFVVALQQGGINFNQRGT